MKKNLLSLRDAIETAAVRTLVEGGATLNLRRHCLASLQKGYMVSIFPEHERKIAIHREPLVDALLNYSLVFRELLMTRNHFLGVWMEGGKAVLDVSVHIRRRSLAAVIGRATKQRAIYDIARAESEALLDHPSIACYEQVLEDESNGARESSRLIRLLSMFRV